VTVSETLLPAHCECVCQRAMAPKGQRRRRRRMASRAQVFRENGLVSIKAMETYSVGADGLEIPADRSFTARTISVHLVGTGPVVVQVELFGPGNRAVWRCAPISVGVIPVRRTFRWPGRAAAMWPSQSKDTIFKVILPCPGKAFANNSVCVNYTVTATLSADYDQQICPKMHGVISKLADTFQSVELV
jgi:hypothetical protein